jgi:hypothetical protein
MIDIIRSFHLGRNLDFLEVREEDANDTSFYENTPQATGSFDNPSTFVIPSQPIDYVVIPSSELAAKNKPTNIYVDAPPPEVSLPFEGNNLISKDVDTFENLQPFVNLDR